MNTQKVAKVAKIKNFRTNFVVDNVVIGVRNQLKYRLGESEYWNVIWSEEDIDRLDEIEDIDCYSDVELTPEGKMMLAKAKADKKRKDQDEDDED